MKAGFRATIFFVVYGLLATPAWSQIGNIRGTVTDETGAVLPGATVTIRSEAIIGGTREQVTNELGVYRFISIPIGTYDVEAALSGFETKRIEAVRVTLNATATVDIPLKLSAVTETVTVTGESPIVDVTNAGIQSGFQEEMIDELPTQRNMADLIQVLPGMSVDVGDGNTARTIAYGSNRQSSSWNVDGIDVTAPETGAAWLTVNPDNIEELQVMGVGAPAEYGNHTGAVMNVVTKKGSNTVSGGANYYFQTPGLTATNIIKPTPSGDETGFVRDVFRDFTARIGGPISKDNVWFYGSFQYAQSASKEPGVDESVVQPTDEGYNFDIRITSRLNEKNELTGFFHYSDGDGFSAANPFDAQSALPKAHDYNPGWGVNLTSTISTNTILELKYAGWWAYEDWLSTTGSLEEPFYDFTPPGGQTTYSGGIGAYQGNTWVYNTWRNQFNAKVTHYTDDFLGAQHDFKFGVQFSRGVAFTPGTGIGPTGSYMYHYSPYYYRVTQDPYQYGGVADDLGFFLDDSIKIGDRLTINAGIRYDHNKGYVPEYDRLTIGDNTDFVKAGYFVKTGETVPGRDDISNWNLISPRIGFAFQPDKEGRSVIRGSFGVYYDHNVIGNWDAPAPDVPTKFYSVGTSRNGPFEVFNEVGTANLEFDPDLSAPRALQYAAGYEQQIGSSISIGAEYIHKYTNDLIGWEILGGVWEPASVVDPFTGQSYSLLSQVQIPTRRKGNDPGDWPGSENLDYEQTYDGVILTFDKRMSNRWGLFLNYTWSKSEGLIPRPLNQRQFNPPYGGTEGRDPNHLIRGYQRLQGDRPNMFRAQGVFQLPWDVMFSASLELSDGRAHNRQLRVRGLGQGTVDTIIEPGGAYRYTPIQNIDLSIGKRVHLGGNAYFRIDGRFYNLLNQDTIITYNNLRLQTPDPAYSSIQEQFYNVSAVEWYKPRRLEIRLGVEF
jgi:hypothetical protein